MSPAWQRVGGGEGEEEEEWRGDEKLRRDDEQQQQQQQRSGAVRPAQVGWMDGWMDARVGVCPCGWVPGVMNFLQFDPFRKLISKINPYKNLSQKTSFQKD